MTKPDIKELQSMFSGIRASAAQTGQNTDQDVATEMRLNRMAKTAGYGGGSISLAAERPNDPMFYWRNSNLPYNIWRQDEMIRIREFCRILYLTHPVIGSVIAFVAYFLLLARIEAEKAAYSTVLFPVVALSLSTFFEGYRWTWSAAGGILLIFLGNILVLQRKRSAVGRS